MRRNFIVLLIFTAFHLTGVNAQKGLQIGDTMPNVYVKLLTAEGLKRVPLRDFYRDKPLILDFWATWCSACVKGMIHADTLLKQMNCLVNFLALSYEKEATVRSFLQRNQTMKGLGLLYAAEDSVLMGRLLRFKVLPHEVWIGKDGVIKAITKASDIDEESIGDFAKGRPLQLPVKEDVLDFDATKPLQVTDKELLYRSVLTKHKGGISAMIGTFAPASYDGHAKADRFIATNAGVISLFYSAYSQNQGLIDTNRMEVYVKDSVSVDPYENILINGSRKKDYIKHLFCYELILPEKTEVRHLYALLFDELNRILPYTATIEKRKKKCYVLVNKEPAKNPAASFMPPDIEWNKGAVHKMRHKDMDWLANYLNWNMEYPVVNESNFVLPIDMELDIEIIKKGRQNVVALQKLQESLGKYGFELIEGERLIDILVIKDKQ